MPHPNPEQSGSAQKFQTNKPEQEMSEEESHNSSHDSDSYDNSKAKEYYQNRNIDPATDPRNWRSILVRNGLGSFLQPDRLLQKVRLQMAKYGI